MTRRLPEIAAGALGGGLVAVVGLVVVVRNAERRIQAHATGPFDEWGDA